MYWIAAAILIAVNTVCLLANYRHLPGNWLMVVALCLFLLTAAEPGGPDWITLLTAVVLAVFSECVRGLDVSPSVRPSHRFYVRAMTVACVTAMISSLLASMLPMPVVSSSMGAVAGAAVCVITAGFLRGGIRPTTRHGRALAARDITAASIFTVQLISLF